MSAALVSAINDLDLPTEPGVSRHAVRTVLRVYAKIAQTDGSFRYGLRGSKVAALADLSLSTIRRAQQALRRYLRPRTTLTRPGGVLLCVIAFLQLSLAILCLLFVDGYSLF